MSNQPSLLRIVAPLLLIAIAGFAYYAKYHWARAWVDERYPWIKENIGSHLPPLVIRVDAEGRPLDETEPQQDPGVAHPHQPNEIAPSDSSKRRVQSGYVSPSGAVDLQRLAANREAWPKSVQLRKPREFPAVVNGKAVGKVEVPAGSEARLVAVQGGKLGLEFRGGGAWISAEDTDLALRLGD